MTRDELFAVTGAVLVRLLACGVLLLANVNSAVATPLAPDLTGAGSFTGEYRFDPAGPGAPFVGGTGTQSATIFARVGGSDTTTTLTDTSIAGTNPISATLTDIGDGFGGTASAIATDAAPDGGGVFYADTDLGDGGQTVPLTIINSSLSTVYQVMFTLTYDHSVDAFGLDSYANSDLEVELNGSEFFETELYSDTVIGNLVGDTPIGGFGGFLSELGVVVFYVNVAPLSSFDIGLDHTYEGGVFDDTISAGASVSASYLLEVTDIQVIPEPSTFLLVGLGLVVVGCRRFRKRA